MNGELFLFAPRKMIASTDSFEPSSQDQLPNSKRVYVNGTIHPDVRVAFREISQSPTKSLSGDVEDNAPVRVYDTSGPWGDPGVRPGRT